MDGLKKTLNLVGKDLTFTEADHIYKYKGVQMVSTTTLLKPFFPFDAAGTAQKCSVGRNPKYMGKTVDEILQMWTDKADLGTRVHLFAENYINGEFVNITDKYESAVLNYINRMKFDHVLTEVQICHPTWKIAGMIDLLLIKDGLVHIFDWKTNSSVSTTGFRGRRCTGELCLLDDCTLAKFKMQLSIYKLILESEFYDIDIAGLKVVHIKENGTTAEMTIVPEMDWAALVVNNFVKKLGTFSEKGELLGNQ